LFKERGEKYILASSGSPTLANITVSGGSTGVGNVLSVTLPTPLYPLEVRLSAATLLASGRGENIAWGVIESAQLKKEVTKQVEGALTVATDKVKPEDMPAAAARWYLENKQIIDAIGAAPSDKQTTTATMLAK
jgi:hypothetical protein